MLPKNGMRCQDIQFKLVLWDKNDGWIDVGQPGHYNTIKAAWNKETKNGTQYTKYEHGSYFKIVPYKTTCEKR